ncbi:DUF881 domain-containing protein [Aquibacillus sp. 3ASR75-11]|uniref:DUF881 domain-containing protein n=1 Tax=Terrihalobacillus insolitus TaxID=2950438 RepID=A0A9X3WPE3_9BACI|nr:DUF881 domain-containing protein [Terrihalobacillus insolitus]MDC3412837.1 DUF881 domain-containing protein [Terrihalobacillus insolitus]MDC3423687.1 DUF881 domain-containing protein [Terrihalobacillus insolitus]
MKKKHLILVSFICLLTGIMIAVQFQSTQIPKKRDTRDLWEVRTAIQEQQKLQQSLYKQIEQTDQTIEKYDKQTEEEKLQTIKNSIENLTQEAGLTEVTGAGVVLTIEPIFVESDELQQYPSLTPDHLNRLINELNSFGAKEIAIENERITNLSPIRYVNGKTYVNNQPLPSLPIKILVLAENPKKLFDYLQVSNSKDNFAIDALDITATLEDDITLPKYDGTINVKWIKVKEIEEAGEN